MKSYLNEALQYIAAQFDPPFSTYHTLADAFQAEIQAGIQNRPSSLPCLNTFLSAPTGQESGDYLAIDLGGTNLRVLVVSLATNSANPVITHVIRRRLTPAEITGTAAQLFQAIAEVINEMVTTYDLNSPLTIGFTFSFGIEQSAIDDAYVLGWSKQFKIQSDVPVKPVQLLTQAMQHYPLLSEARIVAILNDTTGTLLASAFKESDCDLGMILGTGTNICMKFPTEMVTKSLNGYQGESIYLNLESGNFNICLPQTEYDLSVDRESNNRGKQLFEKMVSGKYLGQIAGLLLQDMANKGLFLTHFQDKASFSRFENLTAEDLSRIDEEPVGRYEQAAQLLGEMDFGSVNDQDIQIMRTACHTVAMRSAKMAASQVAGAIRLIDPQLASCHKIAVDGSLFKFYPGYTAMMDQTLQSHFGAKSNNIQLIMAEDGSGIGAGIAAAVALKRHD